MLIKVYIKTQFIASDFHLPTKVLHYIYTAKKLEEKKLNLSYFTNFPNRKHCGKAMITI